MRILCLGNNTEDTDNRSRRLAQENHAEYHGLLSALDSELTPQSYKDPGYYHSTIYDMEISAMIDLVEQFDLVIMLDQPVNQWTHPNAWLNTVKILKKAKTKTKFLDPEQVRSAEYFMDLVDSNKAFCIHPFIQLHTRFNHTVLCCRSTHPVSKIAEIDDFFSDSNYQQIRNDLIQGKQIPNCQACYKLEQQGIVSDRIHETVEWANRLGLKNLEDLSTIRQPVFYDIRPSNKCNLTCRMCSPSDSHLIAKEYKKLKIYTDKSDTSMHSSIFDHIKYDNVQQVYIAGGEPTVISELYEWLDHCVEHGHTDFAIELNTNGTNITPRLTKLLPHFKQFNFVFSIDAYDDLNQYIRWPSDWSTVTANWKMLKDLGHPVTLSTTISIYNVAKLSRLFQFIDEQFPGTLVHPSLAKSPSCMDPHNWPYPELAQTDLSLVKKTKSYRNLDFMKTVIDDFVDYFSNHPQPNETLLKDFFILNDKLDNNRSVWLKDHVPELDKYRFSLYNT